MRRLFSVFTITLAVLLVQGLCAPAVFACGNYTLSLEIYPTSVCANGGTATVTAHATLDGEPVARHTIEFTVSGIANPGSVSPFRVLTDDDGDAETTFTSGTGTGTVYITATDIISGLMVTEPLTVVSTPATPVVMDDGDYTTVGTQLHASWTPSDLADYQYAIGTSPGATDVVEWTSTGAVPSVTKYDLSLINGNTYYFAVKGRNAAGCWSEAGLSDGVIYDVDARIYVKPDGNDSNSGRYGWTNAKKTITSAISAAGSGDEIWAAGGEYNEDITIPDGVGIYGCFNGDETQRAPRVCLAGASVLKGTGSGPVVTFAPGASSDTVLDGFTIRDGQAIRGAGISILGASPTVVNCFVVRNNSTTDAGGVYVDSASSPQLINNTIANNTAQSEPGGIRWDGAGSMSNCIVALNTNKQIGGFGSVTLDYICGYDVNWQVYCGSIQPAATCFSADPGFLSPQDDNYHIAGYSYCRNTGSDAAAAGIITDGEGEARINESRIDIGADEYSIPYITNVTSTNPDGAYITGDVITILVSFNKPVNVLLPLDITLNTSGKAVYASGSGTDTLTFSYTVMIGDNTSDLDCSGGMGGGGAALDLFGNYADCTIPVSGAAGSLCSNKNIAINGLVQQVASISDALALPDGRAVEISNLDIAAGTDDFSTAGSTPPSTPDQAFTVFYVKDDTGGGVRVRSEGLAAIRGCEIPSLQAYVGTDPVLGERQLVVPSQMYPNITFGKVNIPYPSTSITNSEISDPSYRGKLVRTSGSITYVDPDGNYFYIKDTSNPPDDGSGKEGIKVSLEGLFTLNWIYAPSAGNQDKQIQVTGICSSEKIAGNASRVLRPREQGDIRLLEDPWMLGLADSSSVILTDVFVVSVRPGEHIYVSERDASVAIKVETGTGVEVTYGSVCDITGTMATDSSTGERKVTGATVTVKQSCSYVPRGSRKPASQINSERPEPVILTGEVTAVQSNYFVLQADGRDIKVEYDPNFGPPINLGIGWKMTVEGMGQAISGDPSGASAKVDAGSSGAFSTQDAPAGTMAAEMRFYPMGSVVGDNVCATFKQNYYGDRWEPSTSGVWGMPVASHDCGAGFPFDNPLHLQLGGGYIRGASIGGLAYWGGPYEIFEVGLSVHTVSWHNGSHAVRANTATRRWLNEDGTDWIIIDGVEARGSLTIQNLEMTVDGPPALVWNPAQPDTIETINVQLEDAVSAATKVEVILFPAGGGTGIRRVYETSAPGNLPVKWDGKDNEGNTLSEGVYLYKVETYQPRKEYELYDDADYGCTWTNFSGLQATFDGYEVDGSRKFTTYYGISGGPALNNCLITAYGPGPGINKIDSFPGIGLEAGVGYTQPIVLPVANDPSCGGYYTFVISGNAVGGHWDPKGHKERPVWTTGGVVETHFGGPFTASTTKLHYYCGSPVPDEYIATLTAAQGQPVGTQYTWNISGPAKITSGQGTPTCVLEGNGESDAQKPEGDISVSVKYLLGNRTCQSPIMLFASLKPRLAGGPDYTDTAIANGYMSVAEYDIEDQYGNPMAVPKSERFMGDRFDNITPNDWPKPKQGGHPDAESIYHDTMAVGGQGTPQPLSPQNPLSTTWVWEHTQKLILGYGGDDGYGGCVGRTHKQRFYLDHARHE